MKKAFTVVLFLIALGCMSTTLFAAELLDVKTVETGTSVSVEITADIAMTYTYYKVPGQARAVVDIAEADPEKIEPLIVVNKGVVSSISVDSAKISGIVASRIIFNLVSEADISVTASPDRKVLVVTFGGSTPAAGIPASKADLVPEIKPDATPGTPSTSVTPPENTTTATKAGATELPTVQTTQRIIKLEPVVPVDTAPALPSSLTIKKIITGTSSVEIHANQPVTDYKTMKLSRPDRLVIDIPCEKTVQRPTVTAINKFGISKARIGVSPKNIRIVMDSSKAGFPVHTITRTAYGLQINFK